MQCELKGQLSQLTGLIANLWENKIYTAIYHASINVWCNVAYLLTFPTFMTLTNWKWSNKWYTFCSCYSSPDWEARPIKISHTWKTFKLKKHTSIEKVKRRLAMVKRFSGMQPNYIKLHLLFIQAKLFAKELPLYVMRIVLLQHDLDQL